MNSTGAGGRGCTRSVIDISSGRRFPLRRLHGAQEVTTFSQSEPPPRLLGTTWSSVSRPLLVPQYAHRQPSLAKSARLEIFRCTVRGTETYVTSRRNTVSLAFSREAWRLLSGNFARVLECPEDLEARGGMLLGASFAGLAIENSMLGATHALANPLTAYYGVTHGQAIGIMLPHVIRFNAVEVNGWYSELWEVKCGNNGHPRGAKAESAEALSQFVTSLVRRAGLPLRLADCGVERNRLRELAGDAAQQWTGKFNPRPVSEQELLTIYEEAY
jgi:alcohol dehydrogenase